MKQTLEKLNTNLLMELEEKDYENIANNTELHALFLKKIKEGVDFSIENAGSIIEELLIIPEYLVIILDQMKKQDPENFVTLFFYSEEEIKQELPPETLKELQKYKKDRLQEIIDILKQLEETYQAIEDEEIIQAIITNKIEQHYGAIKQKKPTEEWENLLLEALNHRKYKRIYTVTEKIMKKCKETDQLAPTTYGIDFENTEMTETIFAALQEGKITYDDLSWEFTKKFNQDLRIIKAKLQTSRKINIYLSEEEINRPEVRKIIIEEIEKDNDLANRWEMKNYATTYPDLAIAVLKFCSPETLIQFIKYDETPIRNVKSAYGSELTTNAILYNLEHNLDCLPEIFITLKNLNTEQYKLITEDGKLLEFILPKISVELIFKYMIDKSFEPNYITDEDYQLLSKVDITISNIPTNFIYAANYPDNIWLKIIPILKEEELTPTNIDIKRFKDKPIIFNAILKRLVQLKSNRYNYALENWEEEKITPEMIEIVTAKENPLNLTLTQRIKIIPSAPMTNKEHLYQIIKNTPEIDATDLYVIFNTLSQMEEQDISQILKALFEGNKIKINEATIKCLIEKTQQLTKDLLQKENKQYEKKEQIYKALESFLKRQQNIPLNLTMYFDIETRKKATYANLENLKENYKFYEASPLPNDFITFIIESQAKKVPIDLRILNKAFERTGDSELLNYENIMFIEEQETYKILNHYLTNKEKNPIYKKIVDIWVKEHLSPTFFDEQNTSLFLDALLKDTTYTEQILNSIENSQSQTILSQKLLQFLITEHPDKKITTRQKNEIFNLLAQNRIANFIPNSHFAEYLQIDDERFVNYIKKTFIENIMQNQGLSYLPMLLKDTKYKQATLDILKQHSYILDNNNVLDLITSFKEIKEIVIMHLEKPESKYQQFTYQFFEKDVLLAFLKTHSIDVVITYIVHQNCIQYITKDTNKIISDYFLASHPEYKKESYELLNQFYGPTLLSFLENDTILKLLVQEKEIVERYIEIFKDRKLDENTIISINDSFRQNCFSLDNVNIINFYTNTLEKLQRGITEEEINEVIQMLLPVIPSKLEEEIEKTNNDDLLNLYHSNQEEFLKQLIIELGANQNIYAPLFNKITNNLIVQKRNEHRKTQDIYKDTNLKYELDAKTLYNALFNYLVKNKPHQIVEFLGEENLTELNYKTLAFLHGFAQEFTEEELLQIKRNIPALKKIIIGKIQELNQQENEKQYSYTFYQQQTPKKFSNLPKMYEFLLEDESFTRAIKRIPIYPTRKAPREIISNINMDALLLTLQDDAKYNALINIIKKYKFLEWEDLFNPTISKLALGEEATNICNFINAFSKIYDNERKIILRERKKLMDTVIEEMKQKGKTAEEIEKYIQMKENEPVNVQISAYKILKYSTIYSSIANYYKIILGLEDFDLVKKNDGPNSAFGTQEQRLEQTTQMQIQLWQFNEVTIPSFIHQFESKENQKINVIIGNRADSRNLTQGERTGACMRSYGHAKDLFAFCNTDPRGFHFTFIDPETNEYISRVSGFRNGNTIFLNQLRNSVNPKYTNIDVINACKSAAEEIIKRSQTSSMPIENVVASPCYALIDYQTQLLSEHNIGEGVYTGYKDVTANAVVLATTNPNGIAVKLKLDGENQPRYESVRLQPREFTKVNNEVKVLMQRVSSIKQCIEHSEDQEYYKTIDLDYDFMDTEYLYVIIGQDWYVSLDKNGNIKYDIAIQNEHSIEELNEALAKIHKTKEEKLKAGGFTNGI